MHGANAEATVCPFCVGVDADMHRPECLKCTCSGAPAASGQLTQPWRTCAPWNDDDVDDGGADGKDDDAEKKTILDSGNNNSREMPIQCTLTCQRLGCI